MGFIMGNKTAVVGNDLAEGPVKNHPLNVFQLSKHWCLSFLHSVHRGEAGARSPLPGEWPQAASTRYQDHLQSIWVSELWKSTRSLPLAHT